MQDSHKANEDKTSDKPENHGNPTKPEECDFSIAIIGGGIAGLSAAHELSKFYTNVHVFESGPNVGGKARSQDVTKMFETLGWVKEGEDDSLWVGEHGFRLFPHTYRHVIDTMEEIPTRKPGELDREDKRVADRLIGSTEAAFAVGGVIHKIVRPFPHGGMELFRALRETFGASPFGTDTDYATFIWYLLKYITSCPERRDAEYDEVSWLEFVGAERGSYSASFEPLLRAIPRGLNAMKADSCSARSFGNMMWRFAFDFRGDQGLHMERVLAGPTQLSWLEPWRRHLKHKGVQFWFNYEFEGFNFDATTGRIASLAFTPKDDPAPDRDSFEGRRDKFPFADDGKVDGVVWTKPFDYTILAVPIDQALAIFEKRKTAVGAKPESVDAITAQSAREMCDFDAGLDRLLQIRREPTAPMVGLQFYLRVPMNSIFGHMAYPATPWALTSVSQAPFWKRDNLVKFGADKPITVKSKAGATDTLADVLSAIISDWTRNCERRSHVELDGIHILLPTALEPFAPGSKAGPGKSAAPTIAEIKREAWFQLKEALNEPGKVPRLSESMLLGFAQASVTLAPDRSNVIAWLDALLESSCHIDDNVCNSGKDGVSDQKGAVRRPEDIAAKLFIHPRGSNAVRPDAQLRIPNLLLASDYVRTDTDLATMEAANEAAKRAVLAILWQDGRKDSSRFPKLHHQPDPFWALSAQAFDRILFKAGQGHFMDLPDLMATMATGAVTNFTNIARQFLGQEPARNEPPALAPERLLERADQLIKFTERFRRGS